MSSDRWQPAEALRILLERCLATLRSVTSFAPNSCSKIYQREFPVTNWQQTFAVVVVASKASAYVDMSAGGAERFPAAERPARDFLEGNKGSLVMRSAIAGDAASDSVG